MTKQVQTDLRGEGQAAAGRRKPSQVSRLRASWRLARAFLHLFHGLFIVVVRFPRLNEEARALHVQVWARALLRHLGLRVEVRGDVVSPGPLLLASNHISWLDIMSLHAARYCRFVAKADIQRWPLVGRLVAGAGTLFIQRESRRDAMRVVQHMAERLRAGEVLAVFPEGTTSDGQSLLPFHANLLQAAISADAPVQPVALDFLDSRGERSLAPCYIGDDSLLDTAWRTARSKGLVVRVTYGTPQTAQGRDRRAWADALRDEVIRLRDQPAPDGEQAVR
ncbi:phospholipid/glycerol acyltransferase [Hylemonella gracilis ATCC 19624]|uniref:Phospholipid/glycerol acyltransferase n=1 Tax=Hylemonella gracilis ATCC 19624 TaxID=887062 RepID=F3KUD3_9BURK|nr:phospholipid/glycerol acyltransferase [Hylemonella gracilis ATCC 19624]